MAAEWDGLITDGRGMPLNGSFNENKGVRETSEKSRRKTPSAKQSKKKGLSPASSEQSLLSEEHEEYVVTEYVMEYTDIFEPSKQKLDFIDVQEGDAISDVTDEEIVAHSDEQRAYEDTQPETPDEETRTSEDDTKGETLGDDEDSRLDNGITEEQAEHGEPVIEEKETEHVDTEKGIEKREQAGRDDLSNDEGERQDELEVNEKTEKVEEVDEEKETQLLDDERESEDEEVEERHRVLEENDDDDDEKTEVDKLLENDNIEREQEMKKDKVRDRSRMVSAGTQADEEKPLLYTSQSPSPELLPPTPPTKKVFTPKAYPGKVVKSVAIGTDDDDITNLVSPARIKNASRQVEADVKRRDQRYKEKPQHVRINENGKTSTPIASKHRRRENGEGSSTFKEPRTVKHRVSEQSSQSSDANFFRSRLPQTSKRHPKRHVWLCRDSEIHRLISEKAAILRRYKDEGVTGRGRKKGFPNYSEVDVMGLPSVGFSGRTKDESYQKSLPYGKHPSSRSSQGSRSYRGSSSEDDDERTNSKLGVKGTKSSGTFAVGLAARRDKINNKQQQQQQQQQQEHHSDEEGDGCELCAAEAREKEKHDKKLKELEAAAKAGPHHPRNLMLGIVYSAKFLGSTNLMSPVAPNKAIRLQQAQEAIGRIKVPEGEEQPSSDVDLFISTERIKVVSSEQKQTLTDHHLKTISFIADIGNIIVVMARLSTGDESKNWSGKIPEFNPQNQEEKTAKVICHVLETSEAQTVAKTVGQAFSIAYHDFLKTNKLNIGEIEDMEYNGILEQQKILGEELSLLADETKAKEVVIHKKYGECLSLMIVESGWGSMIPTVIIAHLDNKGSAAKSGQLNVGNQILAVNGQSLVGLPLLECQNIIRAMKYEERVALKVVFCPPTVQICINRPDTKYQLGFSVQNGMICSLMRGGIAERGGVRVGHKIIEMNGESVVAASHHHIVDILQTTIGELRMKTMPITLYKLLVGLEIPQYL